jgi:hypothetical protein
VAERGCPTWCLFSAILHVLGQFDPSFPCWLASKCKKTHTLGTSVPNRKTTSCSWLRPLSGSRARGRTRCCAAGLLHHQTLPGNRNCHVRFLSPLQPWNRLVRIRILLEHGRVVLLISTNIIVRALLLLHRRPGHNFGLALPLTWRWFQNGSWLQ